MAIAQLPLMLVALIVVPLPFLAAMGTKNLNATFKGEIHNTVSGFVLFSALCMPTSRSPPNTISSSTSITPSFDSSYNVSLVFYAEDTNNKIIIPWGLFQLPCQERYSFSKGSMMLAPGKTTTTTFLELVTGRMWYLSQPLMIALLLGVFHGIWLLLVSATNFAPSLLFPSILMDICD